MVDVAYSVAVYRHSGVLHPLHIGMVRVDDRASCYRAVVEDSPWNEAVKDSYVEGLVIPAISGKRPPSGDYGRFWRPSRSDSSVKPGWVIANEIRDYLAAMPGPGSLRLWARRAAPMYIALTGILPSLPQWFPRYAGEIEQEAERLGADLGARDPVADPLHDASVTARQLGELWKMEAS